MGKHYKFGGSSIHRTIRCFGAPALLEQFPLPETEYARKGTEFHQQLEAFLKDEVISGVDDETWNKIQVVGKAIRPLLTKKSYMKIEEQIQFTKLHKTDAGGTPDIIIYEPLGPLHVIDIKNGYQWVDAEKNQQCMFGAMAAIEAYDLEPSEVWLHIIQPATTPVHRKYKCSEAELKAFMALLSLTVYNVERSPNQRAPGSWCQYCNKAACPEWQDKANKDLGFVISEPMPIVPKAPELPMDRMMAIYRNASLVRKMLDEVEEAVKAKALAGEKIEGYKIIKKLGNRKWKDDLDVSALARTMGCMPGDLTKAELMSFNELKKARSGKFKADPDLEEMIESKFIERKASPALVPEDAKGEAWEGPKFDDVEGIKAELE